MAVLTKDQIFAAEQAKRELVKVPEWGGEVYVRTMTAGERGIFDTQVQDGKIQKVKFREYLAAMTVVDDAGNLLFDKDELDKLSDLNAAALDRIADVAMRLNHMGKDDVDELKKSSNTIQS